MSKIKQVEMYAKEKLLTETAAHDFPHSYRVMKIAKYIGEQLNAQLEVIMVAALTHDIIDKKVSLDVKDSKKKLHKKLISLGFDLQTIKHVFDIIENMSYSSGRIPSTIEGKIVQDADRLEAIGAISIARAFAYGGKMNRLIHDEQDKNSGIQHFYDKLLLLKDQMNTEIGKKIAMKRHEFMENYLKQFFVEWNLEDIG